MHIIFLKLYHSPYLRFKKSIYFKCFVIVTWIIINIHGYPIYETIMKVSSRVEY